MRLPAVIPQSPHLHPSLPTGRCPSSRMPPTSLQHAGDGTGARPLPCWKARRPHEPYQIRERGRDNPPVVVPVVVEKPRCYLPPVSPRRARPVCRTEAVAPSRPARPSSRPRRTCDRCPWSLRYSASRPKHRNQAGEDAERQHHLFDAARDRSAAPAHRGLATEHPGSPEPPDRPAECRTPCWRTARTGWPVD